jgi:hypothetical protein
MFKEGIGKPVFVAVRQYGNCYVADAGVAEEATPQI